VSGDANGDESGCCVAAFCAVYAVLQLRFPENDSGALQPAACSPRPALYGRHTSRCAFD
jgi:hypothetical protein